MESYLIQFIILAATAASASMAMLMSGWLRESHANPLIYLITVGWMSPLMWALMVRYTKMPLLVAGAVWDTVFYVSWLVSGIILYKNSISVHQIIGVVIVMLGLLVLSR